MGFECQPWLQWSGKPSHSEEVKLNSDIKPQVPDDPHTDSNRTAPICHVALSRERYLQDPNRRRMLFTGSLPNGDLVSQELL